MSKVAERRQNLKDALVRSAEQRIGRDGLAALRARDLAADVGCALGAIYNVFPDLDALVLAVNARTLAAFEHFLGEVDLSKKDELHDVHPAVVRLVRLAIAYLDFAVSYGLRWRALFEHRMGGQDQTPAWYIEAQKPLFLLVEEPLRTLRPELDEIQLRVLARSVFSAVHGIVHLGLDKKVVSLPVATLRQQIEQIVIALGTGLVSAKSPLKKPVPRRRGSTGKPKRA